jgi:hypothetical protein
MSSADQSSQLASHKPVLGIDIDEVLALFVDCLCEWHNATYATTLDKSQFHSYRFSDTWGGTEQESADKVRAS